MKITGYGYSCSHLETGYRIFIEPLLKDKPTFVTSGIAWRETMGARPPAASRMWHLRPAIFTRQPGSAAPELMAENATSPARPRMGRGDEEP